MPSYTVATLFMGWSCGGANIKTRLGVHKILPSYIDGFYGDFTGFFCFEETAHTFFVTILLKTELHEAASANLLELGFKIWREYLYKFNTASLEFHTAAGNAHCFCELLID